MSLKRRIENIEKKTDKRSRDYVFVVEDKEHPEKTRKEIEELTKLGKTVFVDIEGDVWL